MIIKLRLLFCPLILALGFRRIAAETVGLFPKAASSLPCWTPYLTSSRPMAGFGMPIGEWLRSPLCTNPIQQLWSRQLRGRSRHATRLLKMLMWLSSLEEWG